MNRRPQSGDALEGGQADVMACVARESGSEVGFNIGTDEHGQKIYQKAVEAGVTPQAYCDGMVEAFREVRETLDVSYTHFIRTTDVSHVAAAQEFWKRCAANGDIYKKQYQTKYCVGCERFLTDSEVGPDGKCPDHLRVPELRREANYFFLMSKYRDQIIAHFESHPEAIEPAHYRNEILSFLKQPLGDLCISRPKERLSWGIELPFDDRFVTYVWFDALLNYLCATGWPDAFDQKLWEQATHLIGKDILKTHAIYWPAMLLSLGVRS